MRSVFALLVLTSVWISVAAQAATSRTPASDDSGSNSVAGQSNEDYDIRTPRFQQMHPDWAVQLQVGVKAITPAWNSATTTATTTPINARVVQFLAEYQPLSLQKYGVFSIGPAAGLYPVVPLKSFKSAASIWSVGVQARYQARYFIEQPVVPEVGFDYEYWNYSVYGHQGHLPAKGPMLGLEFLLNSLDEDSAGDFYTQYGVLRSYLVVEARKVTGSDANLTLSNTTYFAGIRIEF